MKFGNLFKSSIAAVAVVLVASGAQAAPTYFFGNLPTAGGAFPGDLNSPPRAAKANFVAVVDVSKTESFETRPTGLLAGIAYGYSNSMTVFGAGDTLNQTQPSGLLQGATVQSDLSLSGRFNTTDGAASGAWIESDLGFTISLGTKVGAFGFYGSDFGDFDGSLTIALYETVNGVDQLVDDNVFTDTSGTPLRPRDTAGAQDGSLLFFGFASDQQFNKMVFSVAQGTGPLDYLGFDDLMVGNLKSTSPPNPAPEPGSLALAGLALFAAGWARKTQRRA